MRLFLKNTLVILLLNLGCEISSYAQYIPPTNTSPTGYGADPDGWFELFGTPDVSDNYGWMGITEWHLPVENPPNGHELWITGYSIEQSGTLITDLMVGVEYTLSFYMAEMETSEVAWWVDGTLQVELGDETYFFPFEGGLDFSWTLQTITFTATSETMPLSFKYDDEGPHKWNVSMDGILDFACDTLDTEASVTELCEGDELILTSTSLNGGSITWDGGVINGDAFIPPAGTHVYTATSDHVDDCISVVEVTVFSYPSPEVFVDDTVVCEGESVVFTIDGDGGVYDWSPDEVIVGYPFFPEPGASEVVLSVTNGICETVITTALLTVENNELDVTVSDSVICLGETVHFFAEGTDSIYWDDGIVNGLPYAPETIGWSTYYVYGQDSLGVCNVADSILLLVHDLPEVDAIVDNEAVCEGQPVVFTGLGATTLNWSHGVIDGVPFVPPFGETTYTLVGIDENGCQDSVLITLNVDECQPVAIGFIIPDSICLGDCFTAQDTSVGVVSEWLWVFEGMTVDTAYSANPTVCTTEPGTYSISLSARSEEGVDTILSKSIYVRSSPMIEVLQDTIITIGSSAVLKVVHEGPGYYYWQPDYLVDCPDCQSVVTSPMTEQLYSVLFTDVNGCQITDSVFVWVNHNIAIGVPSAFSPNGDGNNDVLYVKGEGMNSFEFSIYNRYGQLVFKSEDQTNGWDGNFLNQAQNPGVFTWVLKVSTVDGEERILKGNTTLIR